MSRDELTSEERAELRALDGIVNGEQVDEEHLELAALVASVRADAPRMDESFRARLERTPAPRSRQARPPRDLALAGTVLAAAAVALAIVISSGLLGSAGGGGHRNPAALATPSTGGARSQHRPAVTQAPGTNFAKATPRPSSRPVVAPARLVHHASTLVLATPLASLRGVASAIAADTVRQRGVVASSSVSFAGGASGASFSLRVPTTRLLTLVSTLRGLGGVRSYSERTNDITLRYERERSLLARERALQRRLEAEIRGASPSEALTLRRRLGGLERRIAIHRHLAAVARSSSVTAHLTVNVLAVAANQRNP